MKQLKLNRLDEQLELRRDNELIAVIYLKSQNIEIKCEYLPITIVNEIITISERYQIAINKYDLAMETVKLDIEEFNYKYNY